MKRFLLFIVKFLKKHIFSIRFLEEIIIILAILIPIYVANTVTLYYIENKEINRLYEDFEDRLKDFASNTLNESFNYIISENINAAISQITYGYDGRMLLVASDYTVVKDSYGLWEGKKLINEDITKGLGGSFVKKRLTNEGYIQMVVPISSTNSSGYLGVVYASCSDAKIRILLKDIERIFELVFQIAFILAILFGFVLSRFINRPLKKLNTNIGNISSGILEKRLDENTNFSEINELSSGVNKMLDRLKALDDSRQEFVSNVSHELKTPITSIKVLADALNNQNGDDIEVYKDFMQDISSEIDRESKIIEDLLTMVRMDRSSATLNITSCSINELVELVLKRLKPIAAEKNIELVLESFRPVVAEVDEVKITLVITNLVENAIKYNVANGWVRVSVNADHKYFFITVADSGIGIPKESRELIFERFYRVDKARSRQSGGTGLGLAITKNVILMHKGDIKVFSEDNEGSTFTVRIPLSYTSN